MRQLPSLVLCTVLAGAALASPRVPFLEDDYAKARAEALRRKVPLFIDVWAQW